MREMDRVVLPWPSVSPPLTLVIRVCRPQADTYNDKLGGFDRCNANHNDQPATIDVSLRHRGTVALDEVGFFYLRPFERAVAPDEGQEVRDRTAHPRPERFRIRLEYHPLQTAINRGFDEDQQAAHIDILPVGIAGDTASAIDANAAV